MDAFLDFLIGYGYIGMFVSAFIAGSFFPLSSEVVMVALMAAGLKTWPLILVGSVGNWGGSMLNYWIGRMGKVEWIERYLHIKRETLERTQRFLAGKGALMGFFSFLPFVGEAVAAVLGLMRANLLLTSTSMIVGKFLRYLVLVYGASFFI